MGQVLGSSWRRARRKGLCRNPGLETLVFDVAQGSTAALNLGSSTTVTRFATMPEKTSSFGAVASDGWLYVYGGHIAPTHSYSTEAVSGRFARLNLSAGPRWEELPGGPRLQGMNLAVPGKDLSYRRHGAEKQAWRKVRHLFCSGLRAI